MNQQRSRKQRVDLQGPRVDSFLYDESGFQILAYLERSIMYSMPLAFFAPDVIFYYSEHLQRAISVAEIDSKLHLFWSHWHSVDDTPSEWRKIYQLGLKGLPKLDEEWKEWVRARAIVLKDAAEGAPRRLRSASALPRSLLNQGKHPSKSPAGDRSDSPVQNTGNYIGSPTQRKRMRIYTPSNSRKTPNSPTSERSLSKRKLQAYAQQHNDDVTEIKSELVSSNRSSPSVQLRSNIKQSRLSQMMSELDDLRDERARAVLILDTTRDENDQLMVELNNLRDQTAQLKKDLDDLKDEKAEDTRYWERKYQKTQQRRNTLKRRNKNMQAEHSIGQNEASETNLKLRTENDSLQESLDSYKATSRFAREGFVHDFREKNLRKVIEHIDLLLLKLNKVLQGQDGLFFAEKLSDVNGIDIIALFKRGFGLDLSANNSSGGTVTLIEICATKLRSVVLCLVSAALCTWVFEAEVGALFQESGLVYSKLKSLLAAQDRKLTNCFEFAAHERCISDPYFHDIIIPRRARQLARRIIGHCTQKLGSY
ncbi:hypothetical protein V496_05075 [Pseudogymnoascus sp. VKM F-4515 (FW-2607)]|nr:hypothetical protein V496_05075 [Pseudogymnoascus sp. VKM F-4515 (FW-2607)]